MNAATGVLVVVGAWGVTALVAVAAHYLSRRRRRLRQQVQDLRHAKQLEMSRRTRALHHHLVTFPAIVPAKFGPDFSKWETENGWKVTPDA